MYTNARNFLRERRTSVVITLSQPTPLYTEP